MICLTKANLSKSFLFFLFALESVYPTNYLNILQDLGYFCFNDTIFWIPYYMRGRAHGLDPQCNNNIPTIMDLKAVKIEDEEAKGPFGLSFLITQFSISITHNSKMVGPIVKR